MKIERNVNGNINIELTVEEAREVILTIDQFITTDTAPETITPLYAELDEFYRKIYNEELS